MIGGEVFTSAFSNVCYCVFYRSSAVLSEILFALVLVHARHLGAFAKEAATGIIEDGHDNGETSTVTKDTWHSAGYRSLATSDMRREVW